MNPSVPSPVVVVQGLTFRYARSRAPALVDVALTVRPGERWLLLGRNGAGKTTLLRVLGGKHLVPEPAVRVLGRPAFHDPSLAADVRFLGGSLPADVDVTVEEMLSRRTDLDPERREALRSTLGVERHWHLHRLSDGQRRRVHVLISLLRPGLLLLLDEMTTDLDVVARADLLDFLRQETEQRGAAILYATHILDGLEAWATHYLYLVQGRVVRAGPLPSEPELDALRRAGAVSPLARLVERWMRAEPMLPPGDPAI
jgi:CCR4-NOT complex subunit CAF16